MDKSVVRYDSFALDGECHPVDSPETVMASFASVEEARLIRVVPCSTLLSGFARHFSRKGPSPDWQWKKSQVCQKIDVFVSHSWKAPRWQKYFALSMRFNGKAAVILGYMASLTALLLSVADVLPPTGCHYTTRRSHKRIPFSFWCLLAACLAHVSVFLFWQTLLCRFKGVFLDRLCICQTSPQLKIRGIKMLGVFIRKSSSMTVLLDPSYFTRLWCVAELAAFIHKAGVDWSKSMDFCSLDLTALVVGLSGASWFALSAWMVFLNFSTSFNQSEAVHMVAMLLFAPVWVPASLRYVDAMMLIRETLTNFHIGMAQCTFQEDRVLICNSIKTWFGSVHGFEEFIRGECRRAVAQQVGSWSRVPLWYFLFVGLPRFAFGCDMIAAKLSTDSKSPESVQKLANRIIRYITWSFLLPSVWFRLLFAAVRLTKSIKSLWLRYALIAGVGILLMGCLELSLILVHDHCGLLGEVVCAFVFASLAQASRDFHIAGTRMNLASSIRSVNVELSVVHPSHHTHPTTSNTSYDGQAVVRSIE